MEVNYPAGPHLLSGLAEFDDVRRVELEVVVSGTVICVCVRERERERKRERERVSERERE
jgi:hypothetical protein